MLQDQLGAGLLLADGQIDGPATVRMRAGERNELRTMSRSMALPRFKVTAEFKLNDVLKGLGMSDAFDDRVADFSGASPVARVQGWHIAHVAHKAFVEVNEEGKPSGRIWTPPVVANGKLYLRDQDLLFCYDVQKGD
jgi:hypothetical protein